MNKRRIWFLIPTALLPYLLLLALATIFFSNEHPFFEWIMESVFRNDGIRLIAALLLFGILAAVLSAVCFLVSIRKGWDAQSLAKSAMIIKLIQAPAYILIFVLGVVLAITLFTIPFSIGLFLMDCFTLLLTGLLTAAAAINAVRQGFFQPKEVIWIVVLQLVFCADVVAAIVFYLRLRKKVSSELAQA